VGYSGTFVREANIYTLRDWKSMPDKYVEPDDSIREELIVAIKRIFKQHFEESNIHPCPFKYFVRV
jgi:hypothetical protein